MEEQTVPPLLVTLPDALLSPERLLVLLGLSFFLGLAFEEYFGSRRLKAPGGVRTFPLLALGGALLYALMPDPALLFLGGLFVLGAWLAIWYRYRLQIQLAEPRIEHEPGVRLDGGIMALVGNLIAYLLGPVTLTQPLWVPVAIAVAAVLLTGARERLHAFAETVGGTELATLAKFLIIIGIVLPLVPDEPVTDITPITPYQVWLAVVVVSTLSYASYLVQRFLAPRRGLLYSAALGGLYSSTATTVVLSRRARASGGAPMLDAALVLSTSVMFLRILIVVAIFNLDLAKVLAPSLLALLVGGLVIAAALYWRGNDARPQGADEVLPPSNPLEIQTALVFALLFITLSLAVGWARAEFGEESLFVLAALAGITDVDPLVLSIAQEAHGASPLAMGAAAILIAAASNNLLKGAYTLSFAGRAAGGVPALALLGLALGGIGAVFLTLGLA
ncbi:MgtC/SapB family protein [Parvibaculum sp.]|uniref:MgtC/SapB family protein n=1 Tax=Parvibaculum sp. TaxID=2024848 RepID=UPI00391D56A2